ncbi:holo-ACP synthase [Aquibacillus albus]|uniref:Holo-[acyl-carrier-protein] synthase n=1 Tax=Aquibacillus albus TaxID=1168171 RepID=A0ABS2MYW5_9BACI|nr:holo-ACP synthase [Aquibacillus albus]MBM7571084.1 holo-[acyl-carrier protein] synthase [Aquibacillus albus]
MIKGIGIDIVELKRIEKSLEKNSRLAERILTQKERECLQGFTNQRRRMEFIAGRFAAKEAFAKAAGTGIGALGFQEIEILPNQKGAPEIVIRNYPSNKLFVSISHSEAYAVAQVVIEV